MAMATGHRFNPNKHTAAPPDLPFGTKLKVTSKTNGRTTEVTVTGRGPEKAHRTIDLSREATQDVSMLHAGLGPVPIKNCRSGTAESENDETVGSAAPLNLTARHRAS
jgi:rare lipoprotein A